MTISVSSQERLQEPFWLWKSMSFSIQSPDTICVKREFEVGAELDGLRSRQSCNEEGTWTKKCSNWRKIWNKYYHSKDTEAWGLVTTPCQNDWKSSSDATAPQNKNCTFCGQDEYGVYMNILRGIIHSFYVYILIYLLGMLSS